MHEERRRGEGGGGEPGTTRQWPKRSTEEGKRRDRHVKKIWEGEDGRGGGGDKYPGEEAAVIYETGARRRMKQRRGRRKGEGERGNKRSREERGSGGKFGKRDERRGDGKSRTRKIRSIRRE